MKVVVAGGTGFLGSALRRRLEASGHQVWVLTRHKPSLANQVQWDGRSPGDWTRHLDGADAVVHLTGYGLEHWPWTRGQKQRFVDSRVQPGAALAVALGAAKRKPRKFLQISGINY